MAGSYVTITRQGSFRPRVADVGPLRYLCARRLRALSARRGRPARWSRCFTASLQKIAVAFPTAENWTLDNFRVAMTMNAVRSALTKSLLLGFAPPTIGVVLMGLLAGLITARDCPVAA